MENDRFLLQKKVNVATLPEQKSAKVQDPALMTTTVEQSAKEVHAAYLSKIVEIRVKRKADEDRKKHAEAQEHLMRNFNKKPTTMSLNPDDNQDGSVLSNKRNSKPSNRGVTPVDGSDLGARPQNDDDDIISEDKVSKKVVRPKTPLINESVLERFDQRNQKICNLIQDDKTANIDLEAESKPVREVFKASYGVQYKEDLNEGGSANVRINGNSFYASPGRTMRRDELDIRQQKEKASILEEYQKTRSGWDMNTSNDPTMSRRKSMDSRNSPRTSRNARYTNNVTQITAIKTMGEVDNINDSLYQLTARSNVPSGQPALPNISDRNGKRVTIAGTYNSFQSGKSVPRARPQRDLMIASDKIDKLKLFDSTVTSDKIEVRDGVASRPIFSPKTATGVTFLKGLGSVFDQW